jgi:hypothetical protein
MSVFTGGTTINTSVAIGMNTLNTGPAENMAGNVAIGFSAANTAYTFGSNFVCIGAFADVVDTGVSIGAYTNPNQGINILIGYTATGSASGGAIAIGTLASATGAYSVAIGSSSVTASTSSTIAIGNAAGTAANVAGSLYFPTGLTVEAGGVTANFNAATGRLGPSSSTARIKTNIRDLESVVNTEKIYDIQPRIYDLKHQPDKNQIGLIAEEVAQVIPDLAIFGNWTPLGPDGGIQFAHTLGTCPKVTEKDALTSDQIHQPCGCVLREEEITPINVRHDRLAVVMLVEMKKMREKMLEQERTLNEYKALVDKLLAHTHATH